MKKIYLLTLTGLFAAALTAQTKSSSVVVNANPFIPSEGFAMDIRQQAVGDTLLYIPFVDIYVNPTDQASFQFNNEDVDGLTPYNAGLGWTSNWMFFYSIGDAADLTPFDIASPWNDSAFFAAATSWFNPAGQADNWMSFGPITVPAIGAKLQWRVKTNPAYRDGYSVEVNGTGVASTDFSGTEIIYSRTDLYPNTTDNIDTVWTYYNVNIPPSYNGSPVYVGFHHTANDMDVLWLDEILMTEYPTASIENEFEGFNFSNIMPNPAKDIVYVNYAIGSTSEVSFHITDINGRVVANMNLGSKEIGNYNTTIDVSTFNAGIYFVTLKAGQFSSTQKLVVGK